MSTISLSFTFVQHLFFSFLHLFMALAIISAFVLPHRFRLCDDKLWKIGFMCNMLLLLSSNHLHFAFTWFFSHINVMNLTEMMMVFCGLTNHIIIMPSIPYMRLSFLFICNVHCLAAAMQSHWQICCVYCNWPDMFSMRQILLFIFAMSIHGNMYTIYTQMHMHHRSEK